jgi:hypothetical protein
MLTAVKGIFRNGKIELAEQPAGIADGAEAVITFLPLQSIGTGKPLVSLRGIWAGKVPEDLDLEASIKEIATQWKEDFEDDLV